MPSDAVPVDQSDKILRRIAAKRGLGEMLVSGKIAISRRVDIGKIAPATARNQDFLPRLFRMVDEQHLPPPLPRHRRTHQPRTASAKNDGIILNRGLGHVQRAILRQAKGWQSDLWEGCVTRC